MSDSLIGALLLALVANSATNAALTSAQLGELVGGTVKVNAFDCAGEGPRGDVARKGSGFTIADGDGVAIITSLHVVSGCRRHMVTSSRGVTAAATVRRVLPAADLAMLSVKSTLSLRALSYISARPAAGSDVTVLGYGQTKAIQSKNIKVRSLGPSSLKEIIEDESTKQDLERIGIDISAPIINLEGVIMQGDSGGPVFNDKGEVVGVAAGGLMSGTLPVSWAVSTANIAKLLVSTAEFDSAGGSAEDASRVLSAEYERRSGSSDRPVFETVARRSVECGDGTFVQYDSRTFADISDSADKLGQDQIKFVSQLAANAGLKLDGSEKFSVYVDPVSGATFAVPMTLTMAYDPISGDCVAFDPDLQFGMAITARDAEVSTVQAESEAFLTRTLVPGEFLLGENENPGLSMPFAQLRTPDGMIVRRGSYYIGGYLVPQDIAVSHTFRNKTYLGVALRTLPTEEPLDLQAWLAALLASYVSSFAL